MAYRKQARRTGRKAYGGTRRAAAGRRRAPVRRNSRSASGGARTLRIVVEQAPARTLVADPAGLGYEFPNQVAKPVRRSKF